MDKRLIYKRFNKIEKFIKRCSGECKWKIENHSIKSPNGAILDRSDDDRIEKLNCSVNDVVVVFGYGTGKTAEAILDRYKKVIVIAIETIPEIIKAAVDRGDEILLNQRFFVVTGDIDETKKAIDAYLSIFEKRIVWGELKQIVTSGYSEDIFPLDELKAYLRKSVTPIIVNRNTLMMASERISKNFIKSAPKVAVSQSVMVLKDKFKEIPAIVVASGPSLNQVTRDIKAVKGRAIIIAADSALSILKNNGITPDYVCSVDYQQPNLIKFRSVLKERKINDEYSLITVPDVYHTISYLFEHCYYVPKKSFFYMLDKSIQDSINIPMNAVSHLSLGAAVLLGANPIIMAGYDWAYPGGADHAIGAEMGNVVNRSDIFVESNSGEKVMTDPNLLSGLKVTETIVAGNKNRKFINVSETGAKIAGTDLMSMKEVTNRFCKNFIEKPHISKNKKETDLYENMISVVKIVTKRLGYFIKQSEKAIRLNKKSMQHWKDEAAIRPFVEESNKINNKITDDPVFNAVLSQHYFKPYYEFFQKEFDIEGQSVKERISRSNEYFNLIKSTATKLLPEMKRLKRALEYYRELPSVDRKSLKDMIMIMYEYGDCYGAKAVLDRLIEKEPQNVELYYLRAKVCSLNQFLHADAMADYKKAKELGMEGKAFDNDYKQEEYKIPALMLLADSALKRDNIKEAKRVIQMAIDCEPENREFSDILFKLNRQEENIHLSKEQNKIIEAVQNDEAYLSKRHQIEEAIKDKRIGDAISILKELIERYPKVTSNLFLLGSIYLDKKEYDSAEIWLKKAWKLAPFDWPIAVALGKLYFQKGDYANADRFFKETLFLNPKLTDLYEPLGDIAYESEQYNKAIDYYSKYIEQSGKIEIAKKIALCYKATNNIRAYNLLMKKIEAFQVKLLHT